MKVGAGAEMFTAKIAWFFVKGFKKYRKNRVPSGLAATVGLRILCLHIMKLIFTYKTYT